MATHSRILAWRIPRMEEPSRLQSMGLQRVRHDQATNTFYHEDTCLEVLFDFFESFWKIDTKSLMLEFIIEASGPGLLFVVRFLGSAT